jgi:hypothetical protein
MWRGHAGESITGDLMTKAWRFVSHWSCRHLSADIGIHWSLRSWPPDALSTQGGAGGPSRRPQAARYRPVTGSNSAQGLSHEDHGLSSRRRLALASPQPRMARSSLNPVRRTSLSPTRWRRRGGSDLQMLRSKSRSSQSAKPSDSVLADALPHEFG